MSVRGQVHSFVTDRYPAGHRTGSCPLVTIICLAQNA